MSEVGLITSNSVGQKPITSKEEAIAAHVIGSVGKLMPNNRLKVGPSFKSKKIGRLKPEKAITMLICLDNVKKTSSLTFHI